LPIGGNPLARALTLIEKALRYQWTPQVTKVHEDNVIFQVASEIEADGMTVAPGTYPGTKKKLGAQFMGKTAWQDPEYRLILPTHGTQFLYAELNVTPHVLRRNGQRRMTALRRSPTVCSTRAEGQEISSQFSMIRPHGLFLKVIEVKNLARGLFAVAITATVVLSAYTAIKWLMVG
jgi:hypothetical protein